MSEQRVSIELSHDELAWLLFTLKTPPLLGMGEHVYPQELSKEVVKARLQAGGMALRARQLINRGSEALEIDQFLMSLVGTYALAEYATVITKVDRISKQISTLAIYRSKDSIVEHQMVELGIHRFSLVIDNDLMLDDILEFSCIRRGSVLDFDPVMLPQALFSEVTQIIAETQNSEAAYAFFLEKGVAQHVAQSLVAALGNQLAYISFSLMHAVSNDDGRNYVETNEFAVIVAEKGLLDIRTITNSQSIQIQVCHPELIQHSFQAMLEGMQ